jgi:hypothetical protein
VHTVRILSNRKGISTILGTLIFVGILFSSVVPMLLVMNQADTLYEQKKFEQEREDDRRDMEELQMYVYPNGKKSNQLNFTVNSICEVPVSISRIWVNDNYTSINTVIPSMNTENLPPQYVDLVDGQLYFIKIVSNTNVITPSETGVLMYNDTEGWLCESIQIKIVCSSSGKKVRVTIDSGTPELYSKAYSSTLQIIKEMETAGTYNVKVEVEKGFFFWTWWSTVYDDDVEIEWPEGPPIVTVFC